MNPDRMDLCAYYDQPNRGWLHPRLFVVVPVILWRAFGLFLTIVLWAVTTRLIQGRWPKPVLLTLPEEKADDHSGAIELQK